MNIAIIGYGKMGKEIEKIARQRNHTIALIIDIDNPQDLKKMNLQKSDVAIEFTTPKTAVQNIISCIDAGIPVVSGTTGWNERFNEVAEECKIKNGTIFCSSNFSIGVKIFFKVNSFLAKIMNQYPDYNVDIEEIHHTQKIDAPSGTAVTLADEILKQLNRKHGWELDTNDPAKLNIHAIREGMVPGIHTTTYDSPVDFIKITHSAKNRQGLALGAVLAAEFIKDKKGIFTMDDLIKIEN